MKRVRPFDTRQLEAFDILCATGSFTEAARRLLLTQSAVSHSMRTLEAEAGCQLIRRQGKKVSLTEAGERLLRFARPFLQEMSVLREELAGVKSLRRKNKTWCQSASLPLFSSTFDKRI